MEKMSTMKKFTIYFILFVLFFGFVTFASKVSVRNAFVPMEDYKIEFSEPIVNIKEAKTTKVNGYISGTIKNETSEAIQEKYIRIDFISENDNIIASKYIEVAGLEPGVEKGFRTEHKADNIKTFKMTLTNDLVKNSDELLEKIETFITNNFKQ